MARHTNILPAIDKNIKRDKKMPAKNPKFISCIVIDVITAHTIDTSHFMRSCRAIGKAKIRKKEKVNKKKHDYTISYDKRHRAHDDGYFVGQKKEREKRKKDNIDTRPRQRIKEKIIP